MDQVKSNFYENQILEAIETVANGIVSKIKFDQTILCTITNDKNRKKGIYEVTDGTSTFEACSNDDSYRKDMVVYVLIPQGDYENQKTIIGKYVDDTSSAINYTSMMDSFISVNGSSNEQEYSLIANHPDRKFINIPIDVSYLKETNQYNCVGIQADFKTDLSQEHIIAGNYGLILTLYGEDASTEQPITPKSYGLDCSEMYGDPYNYNFYFTQSMVFDLAKDFANTKITNATISFYQNENFKILDSEEKLSYTYSTTHTYIDENGDKQEEKISRDKQPNLFVKNVVLKFGYNLSDITEESIRLYSLNDTKYVNRSDEKNISLKWFVKNEVEEKLPYLIIDNEEEAEDEKYKALIGDYSIYWYRYKIDNSAKDPLAGVYWNIIPEGIYNDKIFVENTGSEKNELIYILEEKPEGKYARVNDAEDGALILATDKNTIKYDVTILPEKRYNDTLPDELEEPFEYTFGPNELLSREKIKVILVRNEWREVLTEGKDDDNNTYVHFEDASKYYESNELVYENANPASQNLASVDLIRNMKLECQDGSNGIYKLYNGVDNVIIGVEDTRDRTLNVIFDTYSTIDIPLDKEQCFIKWKIPKNNSMIHAVNFSINDTDKILIPDDQEKDIKWGIEGNYYTCSYKWISRIAGTDGHYEGAILPIHYTINNYYTQSYSNNTIICEITKYGRIYTTEIEFIFGETGTNGTGYTLSLRLEKEYDLNGNSLTETPVPCLTADTEKKVKVIATLFDEHGNDITNGKTISWNWRKGKVSGFSLLDRGNNSCYIKYTGDIDISQCYGILQAMVSSIWNGNTIQLTGYLPLGIRAAADSMLFYNGTTKVIYNAQGGKPVFQAEHSLDTETTEWQVNVLDDSNWEGYAPYFKKREDSETGPWNLVTRDIYFTDLSTKKIVIQAFNKFGMIYSQSLLYDQNRFGNAMFNDWDGSLTVDKEGNKILSAIIGAGKKDQDNTFTGVVMGKTTTNTGLFGYCQGVQTFGFNTDGTAFIGASDKGQIKFNGTTGTIKSADENTYFDLADGSIYLSNKTDGTANITIDSKNYYKGGYFSIKHLDSKNGDKQLIYIGPSMYYLRSKDFNAEEETGVEFDLNNGKLTGYDFLIQAGSDDDKLIINSDINSKPLTIGSKFSISWDGTMNATGGTFQGTLSGATGEFSGEITAETGTIGGWTINKYGLHNGGAFNGDGTDYITPSSGPYAVFSPNGTTLIRSETEKIENVVFNIGKNLAIDTDGVLYATGGDFTGNINAKTGNIGGWTVEKDCLYYIGPEETRSIKFNNDDTIDFPYGDKNMILAPKGNAYLFSTDKEKADIGVVLNIGSNFAIDEDGCVNAENGSFSGTINADKGEIGGWTIGDYTDSSNNTIPALSYTGQDDKIIVRLGANSTTAGSYGGKVLQVINTIEDTQQQEFYISNYGDLQGIRYLSCSLDSNTTLGNKLVKYNFLTTQHKYNNTITSAIIGLHTEKGSGDDDTAVYTNRLNFSVGSYDPNEGRGNSSVIVMEDIFFAEGKYKGSSGGLTFPGRLAPPANPSNMGSDTSAGINLGSGQHRWRNIYAYNSINVNNTKNTTLGITIKPNGLYYGQDSTTLVPIISTDSSENEVIIDATSLNVLNKITATELDIEGAFHVDYDTVTCKEELKMENSIWCQGNNIHLSGGQIYLGGGDIWSSATATYFYQGSDSTYQRIYASDFYYYDGGFTSVKEEINALKQAIAALK